jgi:LmbE family N-acetylglucosaminyl deacetylase
MNRRSAGLGHAARVACDWPGVDSLAVIAPEILVPEGYRAVIVAPRADDDTLGLGGLIARLDAVGRPILFVAATDGFGGPRIPIRWTPQHKASERPAEPPHALRRVGATRPTVLRTGLREGDLAGAEDDLVCRLRGLILPFDIVLATWRGDGHSDHEAVGRVAARVCTPLFAPLVEVPVWAWHWSFPGDRRIPWHRVRRVFLDRVSQARKRLSVSEFCGQLRADDSRARDAPPARRSTHAARAHEIVFV